MNRATLETRLREAAHMFGRVMERKLSPAILENLFQQTLAELDACPVRVVENGKETAHA